jgi:hypothetical protein
VVADTASGPNSFSGHIQTRLFTGESMVYQVRLGSGLVSCRTAVAERYASGKPVTLHFPREHVVALASSGSAVDTSAA